MQVNNLNVTYQLNGVLVEYFITDGRRDARFVKPARLVQDPLVFGIHLRNHWNGTFIFIKTYLKNCKGLCPRPIGL